jgi:hypothetical protein
VLRTKVRGDDAVKVQGKGFKADNPGTVANATAALLRAFDEGRAFAYGKHFLAIWAIRLTRDAIPASVGAFATAARQKMRQRFRGDNAQTVHTAPPRL